MVAARAHGHRDEALGDALGLDTMLVLGGSGSRTLTRHICGRLGIVPSQGRVLRFPEGNLLVQVDDNVRGRHVFVVQTTAFPANDQFMELLFWVDALKRASAEAVTVIMPYFSYGKGDKKDEPRVSIRGRVCADALESAGADRIVTLDLHAAQIQGFFRVPVDDLQALPVLVGALHALKLDRPVVVSPDAGFAKRARRFASALDAPLAICYKERRGHDGSSEIIEVVGEVTGRPAIIVDDFSISGGTIANAAHLLVQEGATEVYAAVSHGVWAEGATQRIDESPIRRLFVTDSVETQPARPSSKIETVSVAPLLAEAIRRIHERLSLSVLFQAPGDLPPP
jgi:ribose-phosphate pyrophosphokinase